MGIRAANELETSVKRSKCSSEDSNGYWCAELGLGLKLGSR